MKKDIHPKYLDCKVSCGCGNTFETRSTQKEITVEICSACHPFYTGKQKFVDTAGRVEKFQRKFGWNQNSAEKVAEGRKRRKKAATPEKVEKAAEKPAQPETQEDPRD